MNGMKERRRRPRAVPGGVSPVSSRGTSSEWVIRPEARGGIDGFGVFLPSGQHIGFESDRRRLLDLLAGVGMSTTACDGLLHDLEGRGEARVEVFVVEHA